MKPSIKVIRTATVASSLDWFLRGQLKFLSQHFNVIGVSGEDFHLKQVKEREGIKTIPLQFKRRISPFHDFVSFVKLFILLKKEKPTIIHSVTPKAGLLSMIAGYFAGVPIRFHTFTGLYFPHKKGFIQKTAIYTDKILCKFSTTVFPEGKRVMNDLITYNITKKPLQVIGNGNINGVNTSYFKPNLYSKTQKENTRKKADIITSDFVFIFIGRLVTDKGVNELVEAFSNLNKNNKHIKLLLVGDFEEEIDPLKKETIETINTNKGIKLLGFQNDVRPFLSISNVLVLPSYREGFPNSVLEAGAMQLPAIVTNIGGCNEIITDKYNGLLIEKKSVKALQTAMHYCIKNNEKLVTMAKNARQNIEDKFTNEIIWKETLQIYNSYINALNHNNVE